MRDRLPLEDSPNRLDQHGPVFILGCPRSGTTFLSKTVGLIDDVEQFIGVLAPARLLHLIGEKQSRGQPVSDVMACVREVFWQSFWRRRYYPSERLIRRLMSRRFLWKLLDSPSLENAIFCYKEPFLCFAATSFADEFPQAKFIHIIRDGRDNADSMERKYPDALADHVLKDPRLAQNKNSEIGPFRQFDNWCIPWWVEQDDQEKFVRASRYARCVWMWREMTERARALRRHAGEDRYLELSYERFVQQPVDEAQRVLDFLERPMSRATRRKLRSAYGSSVGISAERQSAEKRREAQVFAGDLLQRLGYS